MLRRNCFMGIPTCEISITLPDDRYRLVMHTMADGVTKQVSNKAAAVDTVCFDYTANKSRGKIVTDSSIFGCYAVHLEILVQSLKYLT